MAFSEDDEDLKRAIALSLQDDIPTAKIPKAGQSAGEAINLDSDDGEATTGDEKTTDDRSSPGTEQNNGITPAPNPSNTLAFMGIDRKRMEHERLARKRKVSISPPPPRKTPKTSTSNPVESPIVGTQPATNAAPQISANVQATSKGGISPELQFPQGVVKKTWAFGQPRIGDDIKLEEVLQKNDLNLAILSSFQWEMDWLLAKLDLRGMDPDPDIQRDCKAQHP